MDLKTRLRTFLCFIMRNVYIISLSPSIRRSYHSQRTQHFDQAHLRYYFRPFLLLLLWVCYPLAVVAVAAVPVSVAPVLGDQTYTWTDCFFSPPLTCPDRDRSSPLPGLRLVSLQWWGSLEQALSLWKMSHPLASQL